MAGSLAGPAVAPDMLLIYMPNYREKSNAVYRPSQLKQRLDEDGETALSLPSTLAGAWHSNSILMIRIMVRVYVLQRVMVVAAGTSHLCVMNPDEMNYIIIMTCR